MDEKTIQLIKDYKETFESPCGKRVLEDLVKRTPQKNITIYEPFDPYRLVYDEGKRSVIVYILKRIETDLMKKELENG